MFSLTIGWRYFCVSKECPRILKGGKPTNRTFQIIKEFETADVLQGGNDINTFTITMCAQLLLPFSL